ncbi:MAG: DUF4902 domain-containing protein [Pseudomonadota bacterium]
MIANLSTTQTPQTFSRDMYVRLKAADINAVRLTHLYSEVTGKAYGKQPAGITEWTGIHGQGLLSIAWDWIFLNDGLFSVPRDSVIRTNVMLVDGKGYDIDPTATDRACAAKIATLNWQNKLQQMLQKRELR